MESLVVSNKYDGKKLSKFVLDSIPSLTFNNFCMILRKKDVKLNGKRLSKDCVVQSGDNVLVYVPNNSKPSSFLLDIVYEDTNILIVNKPDNLEVTGSNSLTSIIHEKYSSLSFKPMPCHRILLAWFCLLKIRFLMIFCFLSLKIMRLKNIIMLGCILFLLKSLKK